jgi:hypothetical protein
MLPQALAFCSQLAFTVVPFFDVHDYVPKGIPRVPSNSGDKQISSIALSSIR